MFHSIVFRALQGIGGGGINAMVFVILPEMVAKEKYAIYSDILAATSAIANLAGPILGGLIINHTTWKWIFYLKSVFPHPHLRAAELNVDCLQCASRSCVACPDPDDVAAQFSSPTQKRPSHRRCF